MITIDRYTPECRREWDDFTAASRNATFIFDRGYMEYHADRFSDFSLMARDAKGHLMAILPACREGSVLYSHRGLTYGSWLLPSRRCDALDMLDIFATMREFLRANGITSLIYKTIPYIYTQQPAEEDRYALFVAGARLSCSLVSSVVDLTDPIPFDQGSRQRARKAQQLPGVSMGRSEAFGPFWDVLTELLSSRYGSKPVHSLSEIELLRTRFPKNIELFTATESGGEILAGVVIYRCGQVAHSQYTAASPRGKELSVLPGLYRSIMDHCAAQGLRWFDCGTSNEDGGRRVNEGLLRQKCSYGGRAVTYDTYTLDI